MPNRHYSIEVKDLRVGTLIIFTILWTISFYSGAQSCPPINQKECLCKSSGQKIELTNTIAISKCDEEFTSDILGASLELSQDKVSKFNNPRLTFNCHEFESKTSCPSSIGKQLADDFEKGWGFLSLEASSPWDKCQWALNNLGDFNDAEELEERLSKNEYSKLGLSHNFISKSSLKSCFPGEDPDSIISKIPGNQNQRRDTFQKALVADTYGSLLRIGREGKNLLQELAYLNATLDTSALDGISCSDISIPRLKEDCLAMANNCKQVSSAKNFEEEIYENAIEPLLALKAEKKKRTTTSERKKELEQYEELIKATYPFVMGDKIQNYLNKGNKADFQKALKAQLTENKNDLIKEIARNNSDQSCLLRNEGDCSEVVKHISNAPSADLFKAYSHEENINAAKSEKLKGLGIRNVSTFHWCMDSYRGLKDNASNFTKDLAINAGLTIATGALTATTGVGGAFTGTMLATRLGLTATRVATISKAAILSADSFFFAQGIKDAAHVCSDYEIATTSNSEQLSKNWSQLTCSNASSNSNAQKVKDYKSCLISSSFAALGALPFVPAIVNKVKLNQQNEKLSSIYRTLTGKEITTQAELQRVSRVLKNSTLTDEKRIAAALKLTTIDSLTAKQRAAIITAHNHGDSGIFKYTQQELREKARILKEAGLSQKQIDELMREGITGKLPHDDGSFYLVDDGSTDEEIMSMLEQYAKSPSASSTRTISEASTLRATVSPKLKRDLSLFKQAAQQKHYRAIETITNKFIEVTELAKANKIPSEKIEKFYIAIKKQLGDEGNIRAVDFERFKETMQDGIVPAGSYFSSTNRGAHVGHNNGFIFLKCKKNCTGVFEAADTGSGMQNIKNININDLELIIPDFDKAALEAGISL